MAGTEGAVAPQKKEVPELEVIAGSEETDAPEESQITEVKPRKKWAWHRFRKLDFWNQILIIIALFVLSQVAFSAVSDGVFNSLLSDDTGVLDVYRNVVIIFGSLAAISFGWARAIDNDVKNKEDIVEAGEFFLRVAIFTLIALLFRAYALQHISSLSTNQLTWENITVLLSLAVSIFLSVLVCLLDALKGIAGVALVLQNRRNARKREKSRA